MQSVRCRQLPHNTTYTYVCFYVSTSCGIIFKIIYLQEFTCQKNSENKTTNTKKPQLCQHAMLHETEWWGELVLVLPLINWKNSGSSHRPCVTTYTTLVYMSPKMPANVFRRLRIVSSVSSAAASRVLPAPAASFPSFLAADTAVAGCVELAMSPAAADAAAGAAELQSTKDRHPSSNWTRTTQS